MKSSFKFFETKVAFFTYIYGQRKRFFFSSLQISFIEVGFYEPLVHKLRHKINAIDYYFLKTNILSISEENIPTSSR